MCPAGRLAAELGRFVVDLADQVKDMDAEIVARYPSEWHRPWLVQAGRLAGWLAGRLAAQAARHGGASPATASSRVTPIGMTAITGMVTPLAT